MLVRLIQAFAALLICLSASAALAQKQEVDLLLVLASDVSTSVDAPKFKLQRQGYAAALNDRLVLRAIRSGALGKIAVAFVEWAGQGQQVITVQWKIIDGAESAREFASALSEAPRPFYGFTAIGEAIKFATKAIETAPYAAARRTIDVSGDGTSNTGLRPSIAREEAINRGITINGIVILTPVDPLFPFTPHTNPPEGLREYYRQYVIGGPGAFVMEAKDFNSFGESIAKKLIAEIAMQ